MSGSSCFRGLNTAPGPQGPTTTCLGQGVLTQHRLLCQTQSQEQRLMQQPWVRQRQCKRQPSGAACWSIAGWSCL